MKIVIFGLSITSSWGNGHATTYRALARALRARGHDILFFEHDVEWYASNRDMPAPPFCDVQIYERWESIVRQARRELEECDIAMVGSYFPHGIAAIDEVLDSPAPVKVFYDIDTPITVSKLRSGDAEYLTRAQVKGFDLYFSFTGGPMLHELESRFGAHRAVPLYCSFDSEQYRCCPIPRFHCDMSYMGTYAVDRQPKIEKFLCKPACSLPRKRFLVAGPQYPTDLAWPSNVKRIIHLEPKFHAAFYSSSRLTLNVTRREMVEAGYSPSVRLFEAAACGATIVSDYWAGLDSFFVLGQEILVPESSSDVVRYLSDMEEAELQKVGDNAQARVLADHTAQKRAAQFEDYVAGVGLEPKHLAAVTSATPVHN